MNERDEALLGLQNLVEGRHRTLEHLVGSVCAKYNGMHKQLCAACERIHVLECVVGQQAERLEQLEAIAEAIGPTPDVVPIRDLAGDEVDLGKLATGNTWSENDSGVNLSEEPPGR